MAEEITNPEALTCAWQAATAARAALKEFFEEKVASGALRGEGDILARVFMSLFFALVMARKIWGDTDVTHESVVETIVEIFLNGARGR